MNRPESIDPLAALVLRVRGGDRAALRALHDAAAPKLLGVAMRICRDRDSAEDALQETFMTIWRAAGEFDARRGAALAWMAGIARHRALDVARRNGRRSARIADDVDVETVAAETATAAAHHPDLAALAACLERLEPATREAVTLAYCAGWTREELSARMGAPVNTVKTRLRRALAGLRDCLEEAP